MFERHEFHSALRTIARMIGNDFGVRWARVFLLFPVRLLLLTSVRFFDVVLTVRVLCDYCVIRHECNGARDYDCDVFSHFVWL